MSDIIPFEGFDEPLENWSKLPHAFIGALPMINSLAELKVVLYVLRHTWGYREYETAKHITTDEFASGRKKKDGTRIDKGIGMSEPSIRSGVEAAISHGFIKVTIDSTDLARIEKSYQLNIHASEGERSLPPEGKEFTTGGKEVLPRSEKDTLVEKNSKNTRKREKVSKSDTIPATLMNPMKDAIVAAFGWDWKSMTKRESGLVQGTAKELCTAGFEPDRVMSYYAWCKSKFTKGFSPAALSTHLSEYRLTRLDKPPVNPNKPLTEWEYEWAKIQEQQQQEAALYGRS